MVSPQRTTEQKTRASGNSHGPSRRCEAAQRFFLNQNHSHDSRHSLPPILAHHHRPALIFWNTSREAGA